MQSSAGVSVCVCVLCGVPAVGKSTLTHTLSEALHTHGWTSVTVSYDQLLPEETLHLHTPHRDEEEEEAARAETGWKQHRQAVLECVDGLLQELTADTPHTHTGSGGGGSVFERFKVAMEEQQIHSVLQDTHSSPQRLVLLLDDNFYYHSMRYQVFQLARRRSAGFCQLYLRCPLELCLHRNRVRGQLVSDDVIIEMAKRIEPPNSEKNPWEKNSVTVDTTHTVTHTHIQELLQVIFSAVENPLSPVQDDSEQREADRQLCACSVVHQVDQVCRRLVSQAMITARACTQSAEDLKSLARALSEEKSRFLQELRAQVLQQLQQDECVCVERVVTMATGSFTRRTHVTMERHGVRSTPNS
ncbi:L-seryl-tRNA(Sec) kinase [Clarias gariepinus]|uniref:L-seryl-tRNA(Sec) kinase n=1 Tax=Clarias gariepinus TaxID=13013 RepID=UPI00234C21DA|nr:L-seryl-tRNA(Sec) kinase [Clarias gariepinus]